MRSVLLFVALAACEHTPPTASQRAAIMSSPGAVPRFATFESGPVRPLDRSADGQYLYACNIPEGSLEVLRIGSQGPVKVAFVHVGLEPVAVAVHGDQAWVVNHLSDSVSVVDISHPLLPRVVRTLHVGDEPRDIVFAGPGRNRAFITTAHRGQNIGYDPQLQTPGVPRADVWVFDSTNLGNAMGGTPLTIVKLFSDTPRGLAVSADGSKVYAAAFGSGNKTTPVNELLVQERQMTEGIGQIPEPSTDAAGNPAPNQGLIVKNDGAHWRDAAGRIWDDYVYLSLPDKDVFSIDANAATPVATTFWTGVGTTIYNLVVNPANGKVYASNTEARNDVRFSGAGLRGFGTHRGHFAENRITVISGSQVAPRHLNKHINYSVCCTDNPVEKSKALATPVQMVVTPNGRTLYVAAFGSSKVGVFSTAQLESDTFVPSASNQITVSGGGPAGLVLSPDGSRLYVLTRFNNSISVVNTATKTEIQHVALYNPEPLSVVRGRPFLYDATNTSSHGDSNCANCHVFGDKDEIGWDAGNPDGVKEVNYNPVNPTFNPFYPPEIQEPPATHPMKGVMTTQSLRGLANHGAMHWRGDKTGAGPGIPNVQPNGGAFDENAAFLGFNAAFDGFNGRQNPLPATDMQAFADFALQIMYGPNPVRNLDNTLTPDQAEGEAHFELERTDDRCPITMPPAECDQHTELQFSCNGCHTEDESGNAQFGVPFPGFFGTSGVSFRITFDPVRSQAIKNPHLRNIYSKVGMFGMRTLLVATPIGVLPGTFGDVAPSGDQVRGWGYIHDGSFDSAARFVSNASFADFATRNGIPFGPPGAELRRKIADYLLAFDSNLKPIVGQQVTLTQANASAVSPRIDLLLARAVAGDCELVAKSRILREVGFLFVGGQWVSDLSGVPPLSDALLRTLAAVSGLELTYTCVPVGSGRRFGVDADLDGYLDGDEFFAGSDPRDASSTP